MSRRIYTPLLVAAALAACDDTAGPEAGTLTAAEVDALSTDMVESDFILTGDVALAVDASEDAVGVAALTVTTEFAITMSCPLGGHVVAEGTRVRDFDRATHSGTIDLDMTKTHEACARTLRGRDVVVTLDGDPTIAITAHHAWENHERVGLQTMSMDGGFTWSTADGREGSCTVDVDVVYDPDTRTRTVTGTFCNRTLDISTTWESDGHHGGGG
jgi:hypothetical protein